MLIYFILFYFFISFGFSFYYSNNSLNALTTPLRQETLQASALFFQQYTNATTFATKFFAGSLEMAQLPQTETNDHASVPIISDLMSP